MNEGTKLRWALLGIIVLTLVIAGSVVVLLKHYVGYAVIPGQAGRITTVNLVDARPAMYWHGFYGVAVMVQQFGFQQKYTITRPGVDLYNLLFPCMEYGKTHEIYAALTQDIDWSTVGAATPEFIDNYFGIPSLQSAESAFTENITIELGNRNITGVPATHTYVNSSSQTKVFDVGVLKDGDGNPIIATHIEDFTPGFTGDVINFQLMVPVFPDNTTTYYFFTDPYDSCPEGWGELTPPGNVSGLVTDRQDGRPLPYTRIIIGGKMTTTNDNGTYFIQVPGGEWKIIALKAGYNNLVENISVFPGKSTVKDLKLERSKESYEKQKATATGSGKGPGKSVGPGIGPYLEKPKKREGIDHFITTKRIDRTLRIGQFYEDEIYVFNYANKTAVVNIDAQGNTSGLIEVDKPKLYVKPNSHESFKVTVFGRGTQGRYNGSIKLRGTFDDEIPIKLFLTTKEKLPIEALLLDVIPITPSVYKGGRLKFKTDLRNLLTDKIYNVSISYRLVNPRINRTIYLGSDLKALKTSVSLIKGYTLPKNISLGDKILNVRAEYLNVTTEANTVVTIEEPFLKKKVFGVVPVWWMFAFVGMLAVLAVLVWYVRKKLEEKKRYHLKVDYRTLPQKGPLRNVFIGRIAETNKPTYFELDKLTTHAIVAGSTGGGKTISAQVLVEECLKNNIAVVVFDPTAQWSGFLRKCETEGMLKHYPEFGMKKAQARAFDGNVRQIQDAREKINLKKFFKPGEIQVFTIDKLDPRDIDVFVTNTVREVFHEHFDEAQELKYLMVYDEVHRLLPRFGGSGEGFIQIERACREFRKWGIGVLLVSQVLTDFASQIKANINTEIQMRTRDEGDLKRIATKYGKEVLRSLVKATVGTGMLENPAWNFGKPYFVSWRPILHSVHRLTDEELTKYNKYNEIIDDLEFQISQLKENGEDVFDLELELKLALGKVKSGNFNMVDIYLEGLKPEVEKHWLKLGKKPEHHKIELVDLEEIQRAVEQARKEREKYIKTAEKPKMQAPKKTTENKFEKTVGPQRALDFDNGQTVLNMTELIDVLESMDDETYARQVNAEKDDVADWVRDVINEPELADQLKGKTRTEAVEVLKLAKIDADKNASKENASKEREAPVPQPSADADSEEEFGDDESFDTSSIAGQSRVVSNVGSTQAMQYAPLPAQAQSQPAPTIPPPEPKREEPYDSAPPTGKGLNEPKPTIGETSVQTESQPEVSLELQSPQAGLNARTQASKPEPFYLANGQELRNLEELLGALKFMDSKLFSKYVSKANNDFANWVEYSLKNPKVAQMIRGASTRSEMVMVLEGIV